MATVWSDEELAASVEAYMEMARLSSANQPFSKKQVYRDLAARFARTEKAFEFRMQNISAVLAEMDKSWIPGLPPAVNVGKNSKARILKLLEKLDSEIEPLSLQGVSYREKLPAVRDWLIRIARNRGKVTYGEVMEAFGLDRFSLRHGMDLLGHEASALNEPIITALIVSKATQRCSSGLASEFAVTDDELERQRLYDFWAQSTVGPAVMPCGQEGSLAVQAARFASIEVRPDQAAFRRKVFVACKGRCAISGCSVDKALDAAHLEGRNWRLGHNSASDGLLLRKDLHALYDAKLLTISASGVVNLAPSLQDDYQAFEGRKVDNFLCGHAVVTL